METKKHRVSYGNETNTLNIFGQTIACEILSRPTLLTIVNETVRARPSSFSITAKIWHFHRKYNIMLEQLAIVLYVCTPKN
jgi:hypothetical protein